jgi:hypothetical protein
MYATSYMIYLMIRYIMISYNIYVYDIIYDVTHDMVYHEIMLYIVYDIVYEILQNQSD